jgi:exodeoxyribonuclease VII large subunit
MRAALRARRADLSEKGTQLEALSPLAVLARGYAIAVGPDGRALLDASQVEAGDTIEVRLRHGQLSAGVLRSSGEES